MPPNGDNPPYNPKNRKFPLDKKPEIAKIPTTAGKAEKPKRGKS
jgi:hypothetical protein